MDVYYSVENSCEPKHLVSNSVIYSDIDDTKIELSINNNNFVVNGVICDCITISDWNGDIFEVSLAKWYYFPYPFLN